MPIKIKPISTGMNRRLNRYRGRSTSGAIKKSCMSSERYHEWGKHWNMPSINRERSRVRLRGAYLVLWIHIVLNVEQRCPPVFLTGLSNLHNILDPHWTAAELEQNGGGQQDGHGIQWCYPQESMKVQQSNVDPSISKWENRLVNSVWFIGGLHFLPSLQLLQNGQRYQQTRKHEECINRNWSTHRKHSVILFEPLKSNDLRLIDFIHKMTQSNASHRTVPSPTYVLYVD